MYQDLRMPRINMDNRQVNFKYNIAEYLFYVNSGSKSVKLKRIENSVKTVNTKNFENNYWEFTRRKVIWARKGDNIKNEIDFDNKILEKIKREEKNKMIKKEYFENKYKVNIFDKINKFEKYDSLELKKNKRIHNS